MKCEVEEVDNHRNNAKLSVSLYASHWCVTEVKREKLRCCIAHRTKLDLQYLLPPHMVLQVMNQNGILPRNRSILSPVSASPEETIAESAACWDELSALQVLSAIMTP